MLKVFRDNLKYLSWILWLVVALFIFFIWADFGTGLGRRGGGRVSDNVAAHVGKQQVTMEEFERTYKRLEGLYRQIYGEQFTSEAARQMGLPLNALNQAVGQKILLEEARRMGLTATDDEVRERVLQEPAFKDAQGRFVGEEQYAEMLRNARYPSPAAFEAELREEILIKKLTDIMEANVYVSDQEVEKSYRDQVERARIRYIQLPRARFGQSAMVTDADVKSYFEKHKAEYRLPEQREAAYLVIDQAQLSSTAGMAKVDDKAVQDYYQQHKEEFARPEQIHVRHIVVSPEGKSDAEAQAKIAAAKARLAKGEAFATVAREVSDEPAAKTSGGDLGYFGHGQMDKDFEDAAFGAQVGSLIGPVKTKFGYHLIEVLDKRAAGTQPFEEVREMIRQRLSSEQTAKAAESRAKALAKKVADAKPKSGDDLKPLASPVEGVVFAETGPFGKQQPINGLGYAPAFANAAFALQKGGVSEAVQTPRGWAVLYLKDVKAPRLPELKDVEPQVRSGLVRQKQQDQALQQLRQAKASGKTLDQIAAEMGLEIKESSEFGAQGAIPGIGANPELAKSALSLSTGQMGDPVSDAQGALLFEVKERKSWDPIQFAAAREQTRESLRRQKLNDLEQALLEQRRREIDVTFNPQLLEQFGINANGQPTPSGQAG
ncbi:MAG TPA: peptidyl-prolyl cis-trans isomerase [Thermoanaerobaculia bacterium]|jgi:peptidyl-prolyl cis-trans isomerase D|nr:peptidyl-prolyl cis-trans isomerase [Thermoanaerobaculia bacterium]